MMDWNQKEKGLILCLTLGLLALTIHINDLRNQAIDESLHRHDAPSVPPRGRPWAVTHSRSSIGDSIQRNLNSPDPSDIASKATDSGTTISSSLSPDFEVESLPDTPYTMAVRLGERIARNTPFEAPRYTGNKLSCTNCHLNAGRTSWAAPWIGIWGVFPEYRARSGRLNSLEERINDCFERSLNGRALPTGSPEMIGLLTYMHWLSTDIPTGTAFESRGFKKIKKERPPDPHLGEKLYQNKCAACHGLNGQGQILTDGKVLYPPLWGSQSFNIGAGMARLNTAAAFIKTNMPLGQGNTLTEQEAFDIAAYFTQKPRPDFTLKRRDWPKGDKPEDARY